MKPSSTPSWKLIGPGVLVAATGVGAGDLATATFTGVHLGCAVLWAVLVGAVLKYVLNEGLTRWQLVTGTTLLEGVLAHLGSVARWTFLVYLIVWSYLVAMALMSACGAAAYAIYPIVDHASRGKVLYGALHSLLAVVLIGAGGYRLFELVMRVCIGLMFVTVICTATLLAPNPSEILMGMFVPRIPQFYDGGLAWTIALLGGVGGTVTILCYGYWIREEHRQSVDDLPLCRLDLAIGYAMTALFGLAMVIIGSRIGQLDATGVTLIIEVANLLEARLASGGPAAKWAFLAGAWGAVFSSLLGVWQSVPYLFADYWSQWRSGGKRSTAVSSRSLLYKSYLLLIATVPISGLIFFHFRTAMKINGMIGAMFIPMLTTALLILNGSRRWMGTEYRNSWSTNALLILTLIVSVVAGGMQIASSW
ncbi:MAG: iron transporter [Pirellulaceae bacterium]|nr:MAG: iron transporter [Pirellulaceae bacterium]